MRPKRILGLALAAALSPLFIPSGLCLPVQISDSGTDTASLAAIAGLQDHDSFIRSHDTTIDGQQQQQQQERGRQGLKITKTRKQLEGEERKKRRKKKKKQDGPFGPPPRRLAPFSGPVFSQQSMDGFELSPVQDLWQHQRVYSLDWKFSPDFYSSVQQQLKGHGGGGITMDIMLVPLDTARTIELLLSHVPLERSNAQFRVAKEIPPGWYRLQINFWDSGRPKPDNDIINNNSDSDSIYPSNKHNNQDNSSPSKIVKSALNFFGQRIGTGTSSSSRSNSGSSNDHHDRKEPWTMETSNLVYGPGQRKPLSLDAIEFYWPQQIGVWRGSRAIEVTTLDPVTTSDSLKNDVSMTEVNSNMDTDTNNKEGGPQEYPVISGQGPKSQSQSQDHVIMKAQDQGVNNQHRLSAPISHTWPAYFNLHEYEPLTEVAQRTVAKKEEEEEEEEVKEGELFEKDSFRYKEQLGAVAHRKMPPDFSQDEMEDLLEGLEKSLPYAKEDHEVWQDVQEKAEKVLEIWREEEGKDMMVSEDGDGMDENEAYGVAPKGLTELEIRIEHGKDIAERNAMVDWRANRDRTIVWRVSDALVEDQALFSIELIQTLDLVESTLSSSSSLQSSTGTPELDRDQNKIGKRPKSLVASSLREGRVALLTDKIPGSWGAMVVRIPAWVKPGVYQVRVSGTGHRGVRWVDVSQPFAVQSDPFLYQYLTGE
ncbi:hypothetical protein BGZ94_008734 [Podila epigama]|nr:hypothetical protein BGZ94_008734 [Podila epigama]